MDPTFSHFSGSGTQAQTEPWKWGGLIEQITESNRAGRQTTDKAVKSTGQLTGKASKSKGNLFNEGNPAKSERKIHSNNQSIRNTDSNSPQRIRKRYFFYCNNIFGRIAQLYLRGQRLTHIPAGPIEIQSWDALILWHPEESPKSEYLHQIDLSGLYTAPGEKDPGISLCHSSQFIYIFKKSLGP